MIQTHTRLDPVDDRQAFGGQINGTCPYIAYPFLKPVFQMQSANHPAGNDGNTETEAKIGERHLPAKQGEQQPEGNFINHRCCDKKRQRHTKRHARRNEPDKQGHCRT
jgi:hypothetical protein